MPNPLEREPERRWSAIALALITGGAALLRLTTLGAEELWFDEIFSAVLASQEPPELLRRALADKTNPPGFYLALWLWTRLGGFDVAWMRLLPALAGIALVPAIAWLARALGMSRGAVLLAALLAAVSPLMLAMSAELRAYAPLALVTTLTLTAAVLISRGDGRRPVVAALVVGDLALVTLHYFGLLVVAATVVGISWNARDRLRVAVAAALPATLAISLWIGWVFVAARRTAVDANADWVPSPGPGAIASLASQVVGTFGTAWGAWIIVAALGVAIALAARDAALPVAGDKRVRARWLLTATCLPILLLLAGMAATQRSLWVARYLIIVLPGCWLLLSDAAMRVRVRGRGPSLVGATLAGWAAVAGPIADAARPKKPAWSLVIRSLPRGATVCVNESFVGLPLEYHALASGARIAVREIRDCALAHAGDYVLIRPGTERSLKPLRTAGARLGAPRALRTTLPDVELRRVEWESR